MQPSSTEGPNIPPNLPLSHPPFPRTCGLTYHLPDQISAPDLLPFSRPEGYHIGELDNMVVFKGKNQPSLVFQNCCEGPWLGEVCWVWTKQPFPETICIQPYGNCVQHFCVAHHTSSAPPWVGYWGRLSSRGIEYSLPTHSVWGLWIAGVKRSNTSEEDTETCDLVNDGYYCLLCNIMKCQH